MHMSSLHLQASGNPNHFINMGNTWKDVCACLQARLWILTAHDIAGEDAPLLQKEHQKAPRRFGLLLALLPRDPAYQDPMLQPGLRAVQPSSLNLKRQTVLLANKMLRSMLAWTWIWTWGQAQQATLTHNLVCNISMPYLSPLLKFSVLQASC